MTHSLCSNSTNTDRFVANKTEATEVFVSWIIEKGLANVQGITLALEDPEPRKNIPLDYATTRLAVIERLNRDIVELLRMELLSWAELHADGRDPLCALKFEYQKWSQARYELNPKRKRGVLLQSDEPPQEDEEGSNGGEAFSHHDEDELATTARDLINEEQPNGEGPVPNSHVESKVLNTDSWVTQSQSSYPKDKPRSVRFVKPKSEISTPSTGKCVSSAIVPTEPNRLLARGQSSSRQAVASARPASGNTGTPLS